MGSVHRRARHRRHLTPLDWPAWTDEHTWELGPEGPCHTEDDEQWAAENLNGGRYDASEPTPPEVLDAQAEECRDEEIVPDDATLEVLAGEAEAIDAMSRGLRLS